MTLEQIRARKRQMGYSNAQLADLTEIPLSTLNKILSGATKKPRKEALDALARVLDTPAGPNGCELAASNMICETSSAYGSPTTTETPQQKRPGDYTIEDYYKLPDDKRVELIDGVFYDMASPSVAHQLIIGSVYAQMLAYVRTRKGKCVPLVSPLDVKLDADNKTMVQPDVIVVCDRSRITERRIEGAPDFVMEVVSPSSVTLDYIKKAAKYEAAGVREYWIVDPLKERILTYDFSVDGSPRIHPLAGRIGVAIWENDLLIDFDEFRELM